MTLAYYNEIDKVAAQWLRNLIAAGHIADGVVDERSIIDVRPSDLIPFTQCHFFAGVGVWSLALRRAGISDDTPVWTGSCPCQPFSAAGAGEGMDDQRHLWPHFYHLISQRRPPVVLGEQVASKDANPWLDLVHTDMEALAYAFGAVAFPSAGVGAPHIRDRTYWVADALGYDHRRETQPAYFGQQESDRSADRAGGYRGTPSLMADTADQRPQGGEPARQRLEPQLAPAKRAGEVSGLEYAQGDGRQQCGAESSRGSIDARCLSGGLAVADSGGRVGERLSAQWSLGDGQPVFTGHSKINEHHGAAATRSAGGSRIASHHAAGPVNGLWHGADWLLCRDGKWRPVEPGTFPLAHGAPARVGRLRAYGNAVNAEAACVFIKCVRDAL